ncbi:glycosyl transferase [Clostridium gelidum]|uniref:Glycosyl transferase n=1 Tax=Clostridium gelidum TaxID=704125 RepID=A0ABM7TDV9_9CLOT|nr:glycosyltransferase [Clostridium gelidum]BCZ47101.1 glycosyl transferase [Clostridium gelidum]
MRIAIVTDWLVSMGGAERTLINLLELYPDATIYTTVCNKEVLEEPLKSANIITSSLQKRKTIKNHRKLFPFMPTAIESFDLNGYDMVISWSSCVAKGVITNPSTLHVCYCHSPMRYAWEFSYEYAAKMAGKNKFVNKILNYFLTFIRVWDYASSARVDYFMTNSHNVAKRIYKHYRRKAEVIHSPVICDFFKPMDENGDYYLVVSRLQEYKRADIAIDACNKLGLPLIVVGTGPFEQKLKSMAGLTVKMVGCVSDNELREYYAKCKAFLFPGEEDYGMAPLEAMSCGRPAIAYGKGGALETIVEGKTGLFFEEQTTESLISAIKKFETIKFNKEEIRAHALKFDESVFKLQIKDFVERKYKEFQEENLRL